MRSLLALIFLLLGLSLPALADQPDDAVAEFYKGHAALQQNDPQDAIEHFSKALQIGKLDQTQIAYVHHYRAIAYQRLDKQQEAIDDYTQALAIGSLPQRVQAAIYYNRAIALDHLANFDRAIKDYTQAITLKPDYAEAYMNRGNAYRKLGDNDSALKDYEKSAALGNPIKQLPYYGEGLVLEAKGDKQGAYKAFQTALLLAPDFAPAKLKIEGYQAAGIKPDSGVATVASAKPASPPMAATPAPAPTVVAANTSADKPNSTPSPAKPVDSKPAPPPAPQQVASAATGPAKPSTGGSSMTLASASPPAKPSTSAPKPVGVGSTGAIAPAPASTPAQGANTAASTPAQAMTPPPTPKQAAPLVASDSGAKPVDTKPGEMELADAAVPAVGTHPTPAPSAPAPAPVQTASASAQPAPASQSKTDVGFRVQLGSYASENQASSQAGAIVSKQAALLSGLTQDIQKADLGAKGMYYRLRFGPFDSREAASAKCSALKTAGQACIVVR